MLPRWTGRVPDPLACFPVMVLSWLLLMSRWCHWWTATRIRRGHLRHKRKAGDGTESSPSGWFSFLAVLLVRGIRGAQGGDEFLSLDIQGRDQAVEPAR